MSQIAFSVGTGRCGTKFIYELLKLDKSVAAWHERHPLNDAFMRYVKFNQLSIDLQGSLQLKHEDILGDLKKKNSYFESSAYLSLNVDSLYELTKGKFILMVRSPEKVINSYIKKGWYSKELIRENDFQAPSFQPGSTLDHHSFSRVIPKGESYQNWKNYTQVGKLGWYWSMINLNVLNQFKALPVENKKVVKLENFNFEEYLEICDFLNVGASLTEKKFKKITAKRPNRLSRNEFSIGDWKDKHWEEFTQEVSDIAVELGYNIDPSYLLRGV